MKKNFEELVNAEGFIAVVAAAEKAAAVYGGRVAPNNCRQTLDVAFVGDAAEAVLGSGAEADEVYYDLIVEKARLNAERRPIEQAALDADDDDEEAMAAYDAVVAKIRAHGARIKEYLSEWHPALAHLTDQVKL